EGLLHPLQHQVGELLRVLGRLDLLQVRRGDRGRLGLFLRFLGLPALAGGGQQEGGDQERGLRAEESHSDRSLSTARTGGNLDPGECREIRRRTMTRSPFRRIPPGGAGGSSAIIRPAGEGRPPRPEGPVIQRMKSAKAAVLVLAPLLAAAGCVDPNGDPEPEGSPSAADAAADPGGSVADRGDRGGPIGGGSGEVGAVKTEATENDTIELFTAPSAGEQVGEG